MTPEQVPTYPPGRDCCCECHEPIEGEAVSDIIGFIEDLPLFREICERCAAS